MYIYTLCLILIKKLFSVVADTCEDATANKRASIELGDMESCNELVLRIKLLNFLEMPEVWEMTAEERLRMSAHHKQQGVHWFESKNLELALKRFNRALRYVITLNAQLEDEDQKAIKTLRRNCFLNIAACQLLVKSYNYVVYNCTQALEIDPNNMKGLYRRGQAYFALSQYEQARNEFLQALQLEPHNTKVKNALSNLNTTVNSLDESLTKAMTKMFCNS